MMFTIREHGAQWAQDIMGIPGSYVIDGGGLTYWPLSPFSLSTCASSHLTCWIPPLECELYENTVDLVYFVIYYIINVWNSAWDIVDTQ